VTAKVGETVLKAAMDHDIEIEAARVGRRPDAYGVFLARARARA